MVLGLQWRNLACLESDFKERELEGLDFGQLTGSVGGDFAKGRGLPGLQLVVYSHELGGTY